MADFEKVKEYLNELGYEISSEVGQTEIVVISNKRMGINNLVIDCESPILILEQLIFYLKEEHKQNSAMLLRLLQMNRCLVHGAFVIDEEATMVIYRDTLQLKNLDLNELKGSIDSLSLAMAEYADELLEFAK